MASTASDLDDGSPAPKKSKKGLVIGLVVLVLLLGAGGGGYAWYAAKHAEEAADDDGDEEAEKPVKAKSKASKKDKASKKGSADKDKSKKKGKEALPPVFVPLEPLTVNLRAGRYLQVGLVIQAEDARAADAVKARMPVIRSEILLLLAAKTAEDLGSPEGKEKLSGEVLEKVKQSDPAAERIEGVERVHFSAFIIQ